MVLCAYKHMLPEGPDYLYMFPIYSGLRLINFETLKPILIEKNEWTKLFEYDQPFEGYRLERILNIFIPNTSSTFNEKLYLRLAGSGPVPLDQIKEGIHSI
jgi:hypothetical protein